ncbi:hypothetical protein M427DRAFT_367879 [Gonapodya prolifera JEL478]|uniref:Rotatin N-terminal domain-containing protein n=1 Tax=Gonapodya prolifera (strain JEL478) TaxID=1344416 RepID=A0A139AAR6_GONPJ|nr:hypothetical protein M427DRAFT_367879 [Gonapodya prolifera JEL478]|eukprot:KXS13483.1 hypothetical protein M427DRAFT_367879 [Gonapodya prolifera JEL478]
MSTTTSRNDTPRLTRDPVADIAAKLGHALPEIRLRAVKSLVLKLDAGLIKPVDLSHDKYLVERLIVFLEEPVVNNGDSTTAEAWAGVQAAVGIVQRLAKHPQTCRVLVTVGAVEALQRLKLRAPAEIGLLASTGLRALVYTPAEDQAANSRVTLKPELEDSSRVSNELGRRSLPALERQGPGDVTWGARRMSWDFGGRGRESSHGTPKESVELVSRKPRLLIAHSDADSARPLRLHSPQTFKFPLLTDGFPVFSYIHLSLEDEKIIETFVSLIATPTLASDDPIKWELENKLFEILCYDFGAAIFLQKGSIFRGILTGFESTDPERLSRTLHYFTELSLEWIKCLCRAADTIEPNPPSTPLNATPNVSMLAGNSFSELHTPSVLEDSFSVTFAAHEAFLASIGCMRSPRHFPGLAALCQNLLPFVKLHLDTVIEQKVSQKGDLILFKFHLVKTYLYEIVDIAIRCRNDELTGTEETTELGNPGETTRNDILLELAVDVTVAVIRVANEPDTSGVFWGALDFLLNSNAFPEFPSLFTRAIIHHKSQDLSGALYDLDDILILLLQHSKVDIRLSVHVALQDWVNRHDHPVPSIAIIYELVGALFSDIEEEQMASLQTLNSVFATNSNVTLESGLACFPWFQSAFDQVGSSLLDTVYTMLCTNLNEDQKCEILLRGRLSKSSE